jgi:uncharacterized membrane protein
MSKSRMEAFSDGVIAILITIMVLELHTPQEFSLFSLGPLIPVFMSYTLSFVFLGIYWSNHHHLLQAIKHVNGGVLWANLHLLFWLSLVPFATSWMGSSHFQGWPVALYGFILLLAAVAYYVLVRVLLSLHGPESLLKTAIGSDFKGKISVVIYAIAISLAFWSAPASCLLYLLVAIIWLVPDKRIENLLQRAD